MIAIIKDIYQELSNRKRISIIDVFVSLLVIRITDHFVDINTYFSKIFNNKIHNIKNFEINGTKWSNRKNRC